MKRYIGIVFTAMREFRYNFMCFRETLAVAKAEVLAGHFEYEIDRYYSLCDLNNLNKIYYA